MPENPKVVGLSDAAFRAYIEAICWCSRQEEDGRIPDAALRRLAAPKSIRELVGAGLLIKHDGEHEIHDYLKHQRSRSEIQSFRQSKADSGALGAHRRWHVPTRKRVKDCAYCQQESDLKAVGDE